MKTKIALSLLTAALLPACTTTHTASNNNSQAGRYANSAEVAPPAEGTTDIPGEGPADVKANPAYVPTPVLRDSAASHP